MAEVKIKTHTTYTYETSDGREFSLAEEAEQWQEYLDILRNVTMLDCRFNKTTDVCHAIYVCIKNREQLDAFAALQAYEGMCAHIPEPGYWYYDDRTDSYIDAVKERDRVQSIIETLDVLGK
jgi:uncharacterized protein YneR